MSVLLLLSVILATFIGFAVHRANVCTVRAILELYTTRQIFLLASFIKTGLWVILIALPVTWLFPATLVPTPAYAVTWSSVLGGLIFGMGAAINRGCAFSTLEYLADGKLFMLATLCGFGIGMISMSLWGEEFLPETLSYSSFLWELPHVVQGGVFCIVGLWGGWEIFRLWHSRDRNRAWWQLLRADPYRLSTAALLMGLCGGLLFTMHGLWSYTHFLKLEAEYMLGMKMDLPRLHLFLFLALLSGMLISSWDRHSFGIQFGRVSDWISRLGGGTMMGIGGSLIPGGNDALILYAIPSLSPHALPAFGGVLLGIALVIGFMRLIQKPVMAINCSGDICGLMSDAKSVESPRKNKVQYR